MIVYHIDMVIQNIDMGYELMIWEMTVYRYGHSPYRYGISCYSGECAMSKQSGYAETSTLV